MNISADGRCAGHRSVEIHGPVKQEVVIGLLNNYPLKLERIPLFDSPVVVVGAGEEEDELFQVVKRLQEVGPIRRTEEVLRKPTLEKVRRFIALKVLMEGGQRDNPA